MATIAKMKRALEAKMKAVYGHRINELMSKLAAYQETNESLTARLAAAEAALNECRSDLSSTAADWKDAHDGKMIAETAAFFLLEVCKHTDEVRYEQALKHWPFLEEAKGGRDE